MPINSKIYIEREITPILNSALDKDKIIVLFGPRQSGKTTLIHHLLPKTRLVAYISFDDLKTRQIVEDPEMGLLEAIRRTIGINIDSPNLVIVLDECQKCPAVFDQVKLIFDNNNKKPRFILTGSSSLELYSKTAESLAGRVRQFHLSPFNFHEYLDAQNVNVYKNCRYIDHLKNQTLTEKIGKEIFYKILPSKEKRLKLLDDILIFGSFPECSIYKSVQEKMEFLKNYRNTYIEKDILNLSLIDDWRPYNQLLELLAQYNSKPFFIKDLSAHIKISDKTIKKYLTILEKTMLIKILPIYTKSTKRRLAKSPKLYFIDMGIVSLLSEAFDLSTLKSTGAIGDRLESFVIGEFFKATENDWRPNSLSFWRTSSDYEVDLIYSLENKLTPIEIKYRTEKPNLKSILTFAEEQKDKIKYSCILYRGDYKFDKSKNIHFVPIWGL